MSEQKPGMEIGKNMKMIEFLRCELLSSVATLFDTMARGLKEGQNPLIEVLANIIMVTYALGKRMGIDYVQVDNKVQEMAKLHMIEDHHLEKWYKDLSGLNQYLKHNRSNHRSE